MRSDNNGFVIKFVMRLQASIQTGILSAVILLTTKPFMVSPHDPGFRSVGSQTLSFQFLESRGR